jgi:hypothetical protein
MERRFRRVELIRTAPNRSYTTRSGNLKFRTEDFKGRFFDFFNELLDPSLRIVRFSCSRYNGLTHLGRGRGVLAAKS